MKDGRITSGIIILVLWLVALLFAIKVLAPTVCITHEDVQKMREDGCTIYFKGGGRSISCLNEK